MILLQIGMVNALGIGETAFDVATKLVGPSWRSGWH